MSQHSYAKLGSSGQEGQPFVINNPAWRCGKTFNANAHVLSPAGGEPPKAKR
jgi:hypothetical protein